MKTGVVGCGWIGQSVHIPNYVQNPRSELVAICDTNEELLSKTKEKYNVKYAFTDYEELLEGDLVEAISVCTPTSTHSKIVVDAASNDIHTLCEKPLALNMKEADEVLEAVSRSKIKFMVGFNCRFLPNHVRMRNYTNEGKIGRIITSRGEVIATMGPFGNDVDKEFYRKETEKRVGAFFDMGVHLVDLFIWLFGKPIEVYASTMTFTEGVSADESSVVLVKFNNDILTSITVAWLYLPDYLSMSNNKMLEIIGTEGKLESDLFGPSLYFYSKNSLASKIGGKIRILPRHLNPKVPDEALRWSYEKEIDSFLRAILEDKRPSITGEEAREVLRVTLAAYESSRTKSVVILR